MPRLYAILTIVGWAWTVFVAAFLIVMLWKVRERKGFEVVTREKQQ